MGTPTETVPIPRIRRVIYDTYANLPTTGLFEGDLGYATDQLALYRWSGAAWQAIAQGAAAQIAIHAALGTVHQDAATIAATAIANYAATLSDAWKQAMMIYGGTR